MNTQSNQSDQALALEPSHKIERKGKNGKVTKWAAYNLESGFFNEETGEPARHAAFPDRNFSPEP